MLESLSKAVFRHFILVKKAYRPICNDCYLVILSKFNLLLSEKLILLNLLINLVPTTEEHNTAIELTGIKIAAVNGEM